MFLYLLACQDVSEEGCFHYSILRRAIEAAMTLLLSGGQ